MTHRKTTTTVIPIRDACSGCHEPTLEELLSDSIVRAVMRADTVDPQELCALLSKVAHARGLAA
jgi:hypothetical protein